MPEAPDNWGDLIEPTTPTTAGYLQDLQFQKKDLVDRLNEAGCEASYDEKFNTLIPKLDEIADKAYDNGYDEGYDEGWEIGGQFAHADGVQEGRKEGVEIGKQAEYDRFWDTFQNNGEPTNYYYKFAYDGWTDNNYNPKYDIVCKTGNTPGMALFYENKKITDTKVPINILGGSAQSMFCGASELVTIRKLVLHEGVSFASTFVNAPKLKNIVIDGTIGKELNVSGCNALTVESLMSFINALKDFSGLGQTQTFTMGSYNLAKLTDEQKAIATQKGWSLT